MVGLVRTRHLITHPRTIVREFGLRCYVRCIWRTLMERRPVTFLDCTLAMQTTPSRGPSCGRVLKTRPSRRRPPEVVRTRPSSP